MSNLQKSQLSESSLLDFGKTVTITLLVISIVWQAQLPLWLSKSLFILALLILFLAISKPFWLVPFYKFQHLLFSNMGLGLNALTLGLLYYGFLVPYSGLMRIFKPDLLDLKWKPQTDSFWQDVIQPANKDQYHKLF